MRVPGVAVVVVLAGGCGPKSVAAGPAKTVVPGPAGPAGTVISGTAETITLSCGTPPYAQPARAVHIYRDGKLGDAMSGPPHAVATVSARRKFTARLPAGRYCLSAGDPPHVCDAELVVPAPPGSSSSVWVSHRIPNQQRCDYDQAPPMLPTPTP